MTVFYKNVILLLMLLTIGVTQNGFSNDSQGLCTPGNITFSQGDCEGGLPVIVMEFQITGGCYVEDIFWQVDGGGYNTANLPSLDIIIEDGEALNLTNTTADSFYQVYYTLNDGSTSLIYSWNNGNCLGSIEGCTNEYATNYNSNANTDDGSCLYDETICDCIGNEHTIGVLIWLGDTFADQSDYTWDGLEVNFDCSTWGYDCGDIDGAPTDDPYSVCDGFLPPNNGCTGDCSADNIAFEQLECEDNGDGLLPVLNLTFSITGDCNVEDLYWQVDGGGYTFANLPDAGFDLFNGDGINLINTVENSFYEVYFTLSDGSQSAVYTFNNGNCNACSADNIAFEQLDCEDNGDGLLPVINLTFSITGDCYVEDLYWQVEGGGYTFANMPDAGFDLFNGDGINLINTVENSFYEVYFTLSDGSQSAVYTFNNGNCNACSADNIAFEQLDCADNGDGILPVINLTFSITGDCYVEDLYWQVEGGGYTFANMPDAGFDLFNGDGINLINTVENSLYEVYFTLSDGSQSAVYTFFNGNCTDCSADNIAFEQLDCADNGGGVLPVFNMTFSITGDCYVEDLYWQVDGGGYIFENMPDAGFDLFDGDNINLINTDENSMYEVYFTLSDGSQSAVYIWNNGNCTGVVEGCTNPFADNFDPNAEVEDGSCIYSELICDCAGTQHTIGVLTWLGDTFADDGTYNWDEQPVDFECSTWGYDCGDFDGAPIDDPYNVCDGFLPPNNGCSVEGCTEVEACNYNPLASEDDGSCDYSCYGCMDDGACNFDADATMDDGSCDYSCLGCTDDGACNFDADATIDNGSCDYSCLGCLDSMACNFDPNATIDNGTCDYEICVGCMDPDACNYSDEVTIDDGSCEYLSCQGCTDDGACNYDPEALIDDESCEYETCAGCTDDGACNFDADALIDDESCEYESCAGCTDDGACNFDADALIDDESCEYETCAGCTDSAAINYNAEATIDDNSCIYDCEYPAIEYEAYCDNENTQGFFIAMTITDIGNGSPYTVSNNQNSDEIQLSFNGTINLGPFDNAEDVLISVTSNTLAGCFLTSPLLTMDCAVGIEELDMLGFEIYPNPNSGTFMLEIGEYSGKAIVDCYDLTGRIIYSSEMLVQANNQKEITLNGDLAKGSYFLRIETTNGIVTKQLIIE